MISTEDSASQFLIFDRHSEIVQTKNLFFSRSQKSTMTKNKFLKYRIFEMYKEYNSGNKKR